MITRYVSEIIRLFVESNLFPKEELQDMLCMSSESMDGLLEGSDNQLNLNNLECFTSAFGLPSLNYSFLAEIMTNSYRHAEVHGSLSSNNPNIKDNLSKIWAIFGESNNTLQRNLARHASNKCYINNCQLMLEELKQAGVLETIPAEISSNFTDEE
jgi:hypothetical protein